MYTAYRSYLLDSSCTCVCILLSTSMKTAMAETTMLTINY